MTSKNVNRDQFELIDTLCVHAGHESNPTSAVTTPVFQTSTYEFASPAAIAVANNEIQGTAFYGRYSSPNVDECQHIIAQLERGAAAQVVGSGMAAASLVLLSHARVGAHMVAQRTVYPTVSKLFTEILPRFGVQVSIVDQTDNAAWEREIRAETVLVYAESPANPTMALTDLSHVARLARSQADKCVAVVDSTFATPFNQKPLLLGFDYVIHSATKYLAGHSDAVAGVVVGRTLEHIHALWPMYIALGAVLHAQEAFLLTRGLKTFALRMRAHNENALRVATFLESQHTTVQRVWYPGLASHPQHELARRQMEGGFGGMIAFDLIGGREAGFKFLSAIERTLTLAVSLGGVHTLITHPASTTASNLTDAQLVQSGIVPGLVRMSVGIEDAADIIEDLQRALNAITK